MIPRRARPPGPQPAGARLLRLYPGQWQTRYGTEMLATLEERRVGPRDRFDLVRGALDAWLHHPSRAPAVAAVAAGGLWTVAGAVVASQPVPPDWPGYLVETLPIATIATALGGLATIGCWARRSDAGGRSGAIAIVLATGGHLAWVVALAAAWSGAGYGVGTMGAQALGALGVVLVGLLLLRSGDEAIGSVLVVAPALMLFGWPVAWLGFGLGWTLVGVLLLAGPESDEPLPSGFG